MIRDGYTYNDDLGGSGIDIVFQTTSKKGDALRVEVSDTVSAKDTYIDRLRGRRNYGTCTTIKVRNVNPRSQKILIKFQIPDVVTNALSISDVTAYFYKVATQSANRIMMYVIHQDNSAWTEGNRCDSNGIN